MGKINRYETPLRIAEAAKRHKGWNLRELADELDVDHQTVLFWNQGRSFPRYPMLLKLLDTIGCKFEELRCGQA